ncbi:SRPBCC family protein [Niabella beijingensis]|uniref:SRPBCC family protein n=1 Tax=Niabella beijingensis TaxID=2872700 RepID=UPI001CBFAC6E|nr:SRPBCC domain-containing protein [Niabella beijingensis]MBZ4191854.1 SRPBCC domain-containing protein [Niabella beijingensis]
MLHEPIVVERTYNAPIQQVWNALTQAAALRQWFFDVPAFEPRVGFAFEFTGKGKEGEPYLHHCVVTEADAPHKLAYSWRYEGAEGISLVTYELKAEGNRTHIRLIHTGTETFPAGKAFARENFVEGWTALIGTQLKTYAETGVENKA